MYDTLYVAMTYDAAVWYWLYSLELIIVGCLAVLIVDIRVKPRLQVVALKKCPNSPSLPCDGVLGSYTDRELVENS